MTTYHFTFMNKQPLKDAYLTITAETYEQAREAMFAQFGDQFAMQHTVDTFKPEYFPIGQLAHITVEDDGSYSVKDNGVMAAIGDALKGLELYEIEHGCNDDLAEIVTKLNQANATLWAGV
jgi:hypothetical protein